jgi:hypothetical protein
LIYIKHIISLAHLLQFFSKVIKSALCEKLNLVSFTRIIILFNAIRKFIQALFDISMSELNFFWVQITFLFIEILNNFTDLLVFWEFLYTIIYILDCINTYVDFVFYAVDLSVFHTSFSRPRVIQTLFFLDIDIIFISEPYIALFHIAFTRVNKLLYLRFFLVASVIYDCAYFV